MLDGATRKAPFCYYVVGFLVLEGGVESSALLDVTVTLVVFISTYTILVYATLDVDTNALPPTALLLLLLYPFKRSSPEDRFFLVRRSALRRKTPA